MRKALITLFLFVPVALTATNYYVAVTGNDNNPGTITQPFGTWQYAFNRLSAGDILYVRGGKYTAMGSNSNGVSVSSKNGTSGKPVTVSAYPGEIPVLDCSGLSSSSGDRTGLRISGCSYWKIQGLTIINVSEPTGGGSPGPGCQIFGSSYITLEQCNVHDCANGFTCFPPSDYIYYINCDSYQNADALNGGDLANGFWIRVRNGGHVFYDGCRAWNNSDDGWDAFAAIAGSTEGGGDGYISYNRCWAFNNGSWKGILGNGAGFKTGATDVGALSGVQRRLTNCLSFNNTGLNGKGMGFDESQDSYEAIAHEIYNCVAYNNGEVGFNWNYSGNRDIIRNNISYSNNGSNGDIYMNNTSNTVDHNSWQIAKVSDEDFVSLDADQARGARQADGSLPVITFLQLAAGSDLIDIGAEVGLPFNGKSPDVGAFEIQVGSSPTTPAPVPLFISAIIENATPAILEMTYDLSLNNSVIPSASTFKIMVNSVARIVNSVAISGKKVQLTLATEVKAGDIISVSYTKPANSFLQTAAGGTAADIITKSVTNNRISVVPPVYASSVIENSTPSLIELNFSLSLANVVPPAAAFNCQVNSLARTVNSVLISGNKVQLTLANAIKPGDLVTISYTKPTNNPLQTTDGGQATSITSQLSVNKVITSNTSSDIIMTLYPNPVHETINILFEYNINYSIQDASKYPQVIRIFDLSGKLYFEKMLKTGVTNIQIPITLKSGIYIVHMISGGLQMSSQKMIVY